MSSKVVSLGMAVFLSTILIAQNGFDLAKAKSYALSHHLAIKNAVFDTDIAIAKKNETRGIGLPQVDLKGTFNNFLNLPVQVIDASFFNPNAAIGETISFRAGTNYSSTGQLQVNQLLFNGSYIVGLQVSKAYVDFQRTFETASKEEVLYQVIRAYQIVAVAKDNLTFMDSLEETTQKMYDQQNAYFELGMIASEEIDQMLYTLKQVQNGNKSARLQYENSIVMLKLAMNYPLNEDLTITEDSEALMANANVSIGGNSMDNIQMQILQKQMLLSEYSLKNDRFANLPSLNSFFQQSYNEFRNDFNFFDNLPWFSQTLVGFQLAVPIFSGGQRHYKIQQSKIELMKTENDILQLKSNLQAQEVQMKNNLIVALDKNDLQKDNLALAQKIYDNAVIKKEIGSSSSLEVTQKYNQFISAQSALTSSKIDVLEAKLALEKLYSNILKSNN
jgi:outer membrane protein